MDNDITHPNPSDPMERCRNVEPLEFRSRQQQLTATEDSASLQSSVEQDSEPHTFPIDAVIPWVDGDDPAHRARRRQYADPTAIRRPDVGGDIRFTSIGEIYWCVASLCRFAPFLHTIYIVTDGQDPRLDEFLARNFPQGHPPVKIIDHQDIFEGYTDWLPVFNSRAIETMLHRIPGLAEHYVLLNDDFVLTAPVCATDFFTPEGNPIVYANRFSTLWARILYAFKPSSDGRPPVTFKLSMLRAMQLVGHERTFIYLTHTPRALLRSVYEEYFAAHPEAVEQNIRHRFRDAEQYNSQELQYLILRRQGRLTLIPDGRCNLYLLPRPGKDYIAKKLHRLEQGHYLFCCFNQLDGGTAEDKVRVTEWITRFLQIR